MNTNEEQRRLRVDGWRLPVKTCFSPATSNQQPPTSSTSYSCPFVPIRGQVFFVAMLTLLTCCGCGSRDAQKSATATRPPTAWGTATIQGKVTFAGTPPTMRMLANQPCCEDSKPIPEETVVVDPKGGLANTFVYLVDAPASDGAPAPAKLDQQNCRFIPHAVGVQVGQTLVFQSQDPTMHTITWPQGKNPPDNISLTFPGSEEKRAFIASEFIFAKCDVHPWMSAWIGVFDNPFFAVTAADGSFQIPRVPPGHYKLAAWHEQYGQSEQEITVEEGKTVDANFEFKSP
jgi:plastocyanin